MVAITHLSNAAEVFWAREHASKRVSALWARGLPAFELGNSSLGCQILVASGQHCRFHLLVGGECDVLSIVRLHTGEGNNNRAFAGQERCM